MSIRAWKTWSRTVVRITNDNDDVGTGLLVSWSEDPDLANRRWFIVTAAHVISDPPSSLDSTLSFNVSHVARQGDALAASTVEVPMRDEDGKPRFRTHSSADLIAVELQSPWTIDGPQSTLPFADGRDMLTPARYEWDELAPGDEVLVMGYPAGIHVAVTNEPVVSQGHIATPVFERVALPERGNRRAPAAVDGYLIAAAVMKGSSGSAVILRPTAMRVQMGGMMRTPSSAYLMGIVSHELTRTELLGGSHTTELTGLALVCPPTVIKETLDQFGLSYEIGDSQFRYVPRSAHQRQSVPTLTGDET